VAEFTANRGFHCQKEILSLLRSLILVYPALKGRSKVTDHRNRLSVATATRTIFFLEWLQHENRHLQKLLKKALNSISEEELWQLLRLHRL